jgi:hypothetical protein
MPIAQTMHLKILKGDDEIGIIDVRQQEMNDSLAYISTSSLSFKFIWSVEWRSKVISVLKEDFLAWSRLESFLNDKPRDDKLTVKNGSGYLCKDFNEPQDRINSSIYFTTLMMYFKEPKDINELYSERFQQMVAIQSDEPHVYRIKFPNGDVNHYHYTETGKLLKVDAYRTWFDLVFLPDNG